MVISAFSHTQPSLQVIWTLIHTTGLQNKPSNNIIRQLAWIIFLRKSDARGLLVRRNKDRDGEVREASKTERLGEEDGSKVKLCRPCCQIVCFKERLEFSMHESIILMSTSIKNTAVSSRQSWREFSMQKAQKIPWKLNMGGRAKKARIDQSKPSLNKSAWVEMQWLQVHNSKQ